MRPEIPTITLLGIRVASMTSDQALQELAALHDAATPAVVAFANAHALNVGSDDRAFAGLLERSVDLLLNDGSGLSIAAALHGERFPANLNGTDFTPRVLDLAAARGWSVYLLGGRPGVADLARERLSGRHPGLRIVGADHGFIEDDPVDDVTARIRETGADLLLVGMGNPLQEYWLVANLPATGARLGFGIGAFIDFSAGAVRRAPGWMRRARIEWLYRLALEPERMWQRYVVGNPMFLARVGKEVVLRRVREWRERS